MRFPPHSQHFHESKASDLSEHPLKHTYINYHLQHAYLSLEPRTEVGRAAVGCTGDISNKLRWETKFIQS